MYVFYQKVGGTDPWVAAHANTNFDEIKPTFVTVLALDNLLEETPTREILDSVKYSGSLYFDLDSADIADSIAGARDLIAKLRSEGLQNEDFEIYLSGKKGLHILVSQVCFMTRIAATTRLPAIYKEIAFKFATDTVDFKVYTARKGRMLRTCYNIRENGNYRVPITVEELLLMTPEMYQHLCKAPRTVPAATPKYRAQFSLIYDAARQKIQGAKRKKHKPLDAATLKLHASTVAKVMQGEVIEGAGFNKIAIQLALWARECGIPVDTLVEQCDALLNNHSSDGNRYNSRTRREAELRRMVDYVEDNPAYEYALGPIKALLPKDFEAAIDPDTGEVNESPELTFSSGVKVTGNQYTADRGELGEVAISNFIFTDVVKMMDRETGEIRGLLAKAKGLDDNFPPLAMDTKTFTGSASLQNAIGPLGGSFTGSDIHARGIMQIMLKRVSETKYIVDSEGINVISIPIHSNPVFREPFVIWADHSGIRLPDALQGQGVDFAFQGYPEPQGVLQADITLAPEIPAFLEVEGNKERMKKVLTDFLDCQTPEVLGKMLGWMAACPWRQIAHQVEGQFPLLQVYGSAGSGKTDMTSLMLRMFYYRTKPASATPSGTPFGLQSLVGSSGSIPILLDEYKPAKMRPENLEKYRAMFRDCYNMKETVRGGGNARKDNYQALNRVSLTGPVVFAAEALESESAITHRCVTVSIRRDTSYRGAKNFSRFKFAQKNADVFSVLGHALAARVISMDSIGFFKEQFTPLHERACAKYMPQGEEDSADMSEEERKERQSTEQRVVFNNTIALFGLLNLRSLIKDIFEDEFDDLFKERFRLMSNGIFTGMADIAGSTMAEYIKVLVVMSDMTKLQQDDRKRLVEGFDYNLSEIGGKAVLVLNSRIAYSKYRQYMKFSGQEFFFNDELSFGQGLKNSSQFIAVGTGTNRVNAETIVLDVEDLIRCGMPAWEGKAVAFPS